MYDNQLEQNPGQSENWNGGFISGEQGPLLIERVTWWF
jgi:hypothetical protein